MLETTTITTVEAKALNTEIADKGITMSLNDYRALTEQIRINGVMIPIVAYKTNKTKDMLVDGRHRIKACRDLGISDIPIEYIDKDEADKYFDTFDTIKNRTPKQKAIQAGRRVISGMKQSDVVRLTGVSKGNVSMAVQLIKLDNLTASKIFSNEQIYNIDGKPLNSLDKILKDVKERISGFETMKLERNGINKITSEQAYDKLIELVNDDEDNYNALMSAMMKMSSKMKLMIDKDREVEERISEMVGIPNLDF